MIILPQKKSEKSDVKEKAIKVVYCLYRVSTKCQVEENDIPMQRTACHEFAEKQFGWVIKKEFYELGVSEYKVSADDRDEIQELKASAERGEFDVLLVFMYDRLGRRDDETPFVLRWFYENGIEIWSVKEGQKRFDNNTDDLLNYMYFWAAKAESLKTSMRVRTKLRQMVSEGKYTGGIPPFGYKLVLSGEVNHKGKQLREFKIVPKEAEIVRMIFNNTVVESMGTHNIVTELNNMGIRTHNKAKFQSITINRILKNPIYCGYYYRAEILSPRVEKLKIIDDSLFNEAQKIIALRSKTHKNRRNDIRAESVQLLSDVIYCDDCGSKLCPTSNYYSYTTKNGEEHYNKRSRYICAGRAMSRSDCKGQGSYTCKYVDDFVSKYVKDCIEIISSEDTNINAEKGYMRTLGRLNRKISKKEEQRKLSEFRIHTLYSKVADSFTGNISFSPEILSDAIQQEKESLDIIDKELSALKIEVEDTNTLKKTVKIRYKKLTKLLNRFEGSDISEKRDIINELISKVSVGRGSSCDYKVKITLNDWCVDFIKN